MMVYHAVCVQFSADCSLIAGAAVFRLFLQCCIYCGDYFKSEYSVILFPLSSVGAYSVLKLRHVQRCIDLLSPVADREWELGEGRGRGLAGNIFIFIKREVLKIKVSSAAKIDQFWSPG